MKEEQQEFSLFSDKKNPDEITRISGMYQDWFLDYASYVILERAIPAIEDGLKPVQRRILHSMKDLDDGRYNKVANIIGHTMQYHPHGDASIGDAIVQIGQKDLLIDTQGNWGNIFTGDSAAAARYIEARLSKFALEILFSPKITNWQTSYDGRKNEPINLPVKFPLLLAQGVEGIAVGLSTKILPHNFNELIDASLKYLKNKPFELCPDFSTGGIMDVTGYNDGKRGGRIRVRAKIKVLNKTTLVIEELPYTKDTSSLIESILKANDKGKIKIKKIEDNTASKVEILVYLPSGISPDKTIDALYAFTDCEISISPLGCIIQDNKPLFIGVSEMLQISVDYTLKLLTAELEIKLKELLEQWHFLSLEKVFIENKIYRDIEEETTWEGVIRAIKKGLKPYIGHLKRDLTQEDIVRLTEIKIKRISKFDSNQADQKIESLEGDIEEVKNHLEHIVPFTIKYFTSLKKRYGAAHQRKTQIAVFADIEATKVVMKNAKLYVNRTEGFVGLGLRKDEFVCDCSDIDDVIVITKSGKMVITKVSDKTFIDKNIIYVNVFRKKDRRTIYNFIYKDGRGGAFYIKRFFVDGITRDKEYNLTQAKPSSEVTYLTVNPNGEAEKITVFLRETGSVKKLKWDIDFSDILIKSRTSKGNLVTKHPVKRIALKEKGVSTLKPRDIWFDPIISRLNVEGRGTLLGSFEADDRLLLITKKGLLRTLIPELSSRFEEDILVLEKLKSEHPITLVHYDGSRERYFVKRFLVEKNQKQESIITEHPKSFLKYATTERRPVIEIRYRKTSKTAKPNQNIVLEEIVGIKSLKAIGNQLTSDKILDIKPCEPLPYDELANDTDDNKTNSQSLFDFE